MAAGLLAAATLAGPACAADPFGLWQTEVRPRGAETPAPMRLGPVDVAPDLRVGLAHDSNVYAQGAGARSDWRTTVEPQVRLALQTGPHALEFAVRLRDVRHRREGRLDHTDGVFAGTATLAADAATALTVMGEAGRRHLLPGAPDAADAAAEAAPVGWVAAGVAVARRMGRVQAGAGGGVEVVEHRDVARIGGGLTEQDFRDRTEWRVNVFASYDVSPDMTAFAEVEGDRREHGAADPGGVQHDSRALGMVAGMRVEVAEILAAEVRGGWLTRQFEDTALDDVSGLDAGLAVRWRATPLTALAVEIDRDVLESGLPGGAAIVRTRARLGLDHELLRTLMVRPAVAYRRDAHAGLARTDEVYAAGVKLDYLVNRSLAAGLSVSHGRRESTAPGRDHDRTVAEVQGRVRF
ncbi:outer membrane beta-barrel protein [Futiania mangrovi]|uniref:Outer membrane beta-barrel protein n=1 Tax=Futiania mangrovi TaxID=2959716 RepID=A0A9J6PGY2_9PROT|nr:outer membrane beta-barrel protein [Futiania mangrovii]MCP1335354.1 outer membrane beta-barrel protein [Futiania mangrovii]